MPGQACPGSRRVGGKHGESSCRHADEVEFCMKGRYPPTAPFFFGALARLSLPLSPLCDLQDVSSSIAFLASALASAGTDGEAHPHRFVKALVPSIPSMARRIVPSAIVLIRCRFPMPPYRRACGQIHDGRLLLDCFWAMRVGNPGAHR